MSVQLKAKVIFHFLINSKRVESSFLSEFCLTLYFEQQSLSSYFETTAIPSHFIRTHFWQWHSREYYLEIELTWIAFRLTFSKRDRLIIIVENGDQQLRLNKWIGLKYERMDSGWIWPSIFSFNCTFSNFICEAEWEKFTIILKPLNFYRNCHQW